MIDISKILTISASEWARTSGDSLEKYNAQGVHVSEFVHFSDEHPTLVPDETFASKVPDKAVVVVNYIKQLTGDYYFSISGTALTPKK